MLTLGLSAVFLIEFIRALPWPDGVKQRKPLVCDACMVGWLALAYAWGAAVFGSLDPEQLFSSAGIALLLLALLKHWKGLSLTPPG